MKPWSRLDALAQKASALSLDQQQRLEKDAAKKEAKAEAKADAEAKKRQVRRLTEINGSMHCLNIRFLCHRRQRYFFHLEFRRHLSCLPIPLR